MDLISYIQGALTLVISNWPHTLRSSDFEITQFARLVPELYATRCNLLIIIIIIIIIITTTIITITIIIIIILFISHNQ